MSDERIIHGIVGAFSGALIYSAFKQKHNEWITPDGLITSMMGGAATGILPDILEPAKNPNHRQFFHSILTLGLNSYLAGSVLQSNLDNEKKGILLATLGGYSSHLIIDSTSPKGLPFGLESLSD